MSQRAYARRLLVANWKGIRFHCFDVDRYLTGLQGRNGAGKTTVMASYVTAMLPNQRLLSFPNLTGSNHAKSADTGIWGRLGDGVCYAIIEWITPRGLPFWAGVTLTRGSMPHIDIKQFTIEGLSEEISPHRTFLIGEGRQFSLPTYGQLREHVTLTGGHITNHRTLAEYMRTLYEVGITPLPMLTQEEQARYYRLLASSMSGSSLGELAKSGLRDFLLAEDAGLEKRVMNMRGCLIECRQTRHELDHAQAAHAEISDLYDAAWQMSGFAYFGAVGRYEQAQSVWTRQVHVLREVKAAEVQLKEELARIENELGEIGLLLVIRRDELKIKEVNLANAEQANKLRTELDWLENDRANYEIRYQQNEKEKERAEDAELTAKEAFDVAMQEQSRIATELGDLNLAIEESTRRVTLLRLARDRLEDACQAIGNPLFEPGSTVTTKLELEARYSASNALFSRIDSQLHAFDDHQARFNDLYVVVDQIATAAGEGKIVPEEAYAFGIRLDERLRANTALAQQVASLTVALGQSRILTDQQQKTQQVAQTLGINSRRALETALETAIAEVEARENERRSREIERSEKLAILAEIQSKLPGLEELCRQFRNGREKRRALIELGVSAEWMHEHTEFETHVEALRQFSHNQEAERIELEKAMRHLKAQILALQNQSGVMDARIGAVADQLEGTLIAARFDDLSMDDAMLTEARLGGWTEAIVVHSPELAAQRAADLNDRPDNILLLSEEAADLQRRSLPFGDSELIEENLGGIAGLRLTRRPTRPILGRNAREAEIARLERMLQDQEGQLNQLVTELLRLAQVLSISEQLLALGMGAWEDDPEPMLLAEKGRERLLSVEISQLVTVLRLLTQQIGEAEGLKNKYQRLDVHKELLDPPNHRQEVERLEQALQCATAARAWLVQHEGGVRVVLADLPILAKVPQISERVKLAEEVARLIEIRSLLNRQLDALESLKVVLPHFRFQADEEIYEAQSSLIEALRSELAVAQSHFQETMSSYEKARNETDAARGKATESYSALSQVRVEIVQKTTELLKIGLQGAITEVESAQKDLEGAKELIDDLVTRERELVHKEGESTNALEVAQNNRLAVEREVRERLTSWRTERRARRELAKAVDAVGLTGKLDTESNRERFFANGNHIQAFHTSRVKAQAVLEQLKAYQDVHIEVELLISESDRQEERRTLQALKVWERVHRHIEQRIPRNIATSDDPQLALAQMRDKMNELRRTLNAQEAQMRMQSVGIAGAIGSRLQTSKRLIRNLNHELANVAFGSILGVHIQVDDIEHMKRVLVALEDHGNGALFDTEVSLEEALAQLYRQTAHGSIAGIQLLDYRNYLNLRIEVKRITNQWEAASDSLSTGEAIGVGTAILIMVLRTWNEEAKRIHGKGAGQSVQQVLLDEATRLDPEALDTFTEFCQRMDVQALVAAPSLERPRRATVFILERHFVNNVEQVIIRGQRLII